MVMDQPTLKPRKHTAKEAKADKLKASKVAGEEKVVEPRLSDTGDEDLPGEKALGEPVDFLRKYQYRKQTVPGSVESDPVVGSKAAAMKAFLLSQDKVRMLIPATQGESASSLQSVNLNGYRLDFPKNTYIEVPLQIAEVLGESLKQTNAALQVNRIDGDKQKEAALL